MCPYLALSAIATLFATGFYRTQTLYFPFTFKQTWKWNINLLVTENVALMQVSMSIFRHVFSDTQTEEYKSHQFSLPRTENADCCPDYYPHCLGSDEPQWVRLPSIMTMIRMMVHHLDHLHPKYWEFVHVLVIHYHVHNFVQVFNYPKCWRFVCALWTKLCAGITNKKLPSLWRFPVHKIAPTESSTFRTLWVMMPSIMAMTPMSFNIGSKIVTFSSITDVRVQGAKLQWPRHDQRQLQHL